VKFQTSFAGFTAANGHLKASILLQGESTRARKERIHPYKGTFGPAAQYEFAYRLMAVITSLATRSGMSWFILSRGAIVATASRLNPSRIARSDIKVTAIRCRRVRPLGGLLSEPRSARIWSPNSSQSNGLAMEPKIDQTGLTILPRPRTAMLGATHYELNGPDHIDGNAFTAVSGARLPIGSNKRLCTEQ